MFPDDLTNAIRKTDGIFYSPDFIAEYICRNTIIPILSKRGINEIHDLIREYQGGLNELEDKLKGITILDPACGSGVFLLKAIEILLELRREIFNFKNLHANNIAFDERVETREILGNNIFGVDLNEKSIEIARQSIFLKFCQHDKKCRNLLATIKAGNSLVDDPTIAGNKAFNWEKEFLNYLPRGKFDVVIGNPPWGAAFNDEELAFLKERFKRVTTRTVNSFKMFVQRSLELLKPHGAFGFILPNSLIEMPDYADLRKLLLDHSKSLRIIDLGDGVFQNVNIPSCIITFPHGKGDNLLLYKDMKYVPRENLTMDELAIPSFTELPVNQLDEKFRFKGDELAFLRHNTVPLSEKYGEVFGVKVYQTGKGASSSVPNSKQTPQDKANNVYLRPTKSDGFNDPFIDGINLDRFLFLWRPGLKDSYINYGTHLAEPRKREIFQQKKIVVQQIVSQNISAAYIEEPYVVKNTCAVITQKDPTYSLIFLLSLFESNLFLYIHLMQSANAIKNGYPKLNSDDIKRFPLPILGGKNQCYVAELESNTKILLNEGAVYKENLDFFIDYLSSDFKIDVSRQYLRLHQAIKQGKKKFEGFLKRNRVDLGDANKFKEVMDFYVKFEKYLSQVEEISRKNDLVVYKLYDIGQDTIEKIESRLSGTYSSSS